MINDVEDGYLILPSTQTNRLQLVLILLLVLSQNSKVLPLTSILKSLQWLNNIKKELCMRFFLKTLSLSRPAYLHSLVNLNRTRSTRSSSKSSFKSFSSTNHQIDLFVRQFLPCGTAYLLNFVSKRQYLLRHLLPFSPFPTLFQKKLLTQFILLFHPLYFQVSTLSLVRSARSLFGGKLTLLES